MVKINSKKLNTAVSRQFIPERDEQRYTITTFDEGYLVISNLYTDPEMNRIDHEEHELVCAEAGDMGTRRSRPIGSGRSFDHLRHETYYALPDEHVEKVLEKRRDLRSAAEALEPEETVVASD